MPKLIFPMLMLIVFSVLTILGISGSSVGTLTAQQPGRDSNLVAGTPRYIRWDEWNLTTPLLVAQSHHDFPRYTNDGIGQHDLTVVFDIPNRDWSSLFKPWDIPLLVLDLEHGFAARWWMMSFLLVTGSYLLLLELTRRIDVAVLFSLGLWLSPFFAWWYEAIALDSVGMGMLALASFLYGIRRTTRWARLLNLGLAAYFSVGFVFLFYPPFQVPVALVLISVGAGELIGRHRDVGLAWSRSLSSLSLVAGLSAIVLVVFYFHDRVPLNAIDGSIYPGQRRVSGGGASLLQLLSAPFGVPLAQNGSQISGTNQSEISSFLILGPFVLLQLFRIPMRSWGFRWRALFYTASGSFVLIALWYLVSLPSFLASLLGLDRVEANRAIIGIGVAGFLLMALLCAARLDGSQALAGAEEQAVLEGRLERGAIGCALLCFLAYFWNGRSFDFLWPQLHLGLWSVALFSVIAAAVVYFTCARQVLLGGVSLVVFGGLLSLPVNPFYHGLGVLTSSSLEPVLEQVGSDPPTINDRVWISFDPRLAVNDVLLSSGLQTLNVTNLYGNAPAWRALGLAAPADEVVWNRYSNVVFSSGRNARPELALLATDAFRVTIDPCSAAAATLHVGFVMSEKRLGAYSCLARVATVKFQGHPVNIFVRHPVPR